MALGSYPSCGGPVQTGGRYSSHRVGVDQPGSRPVARLPDRRPGHVPGDPLNLAACFGHHHPEHQDGDALGMPLGVGEPARGPPRQPRTNPRADAEVDAQPLSAPGRAGSRCGASGSTTSGARSVVVVVRGRELLWGSTPIMASVVWPPCRRMDRAADSPDASTPALCRVTPWHGPGLRTSLSSQPDRSGRLGITERTHRDQRRYGRQARSAAMTPPSPSGDCRAGGRRRSPPRGCRSSASKTLGRS